MLKMKRMAVMAVVALGLVALAAPAAAPAKSNKSIERLNKDVKRLGENVNSLRAKTDETNQDVKNLATTAGAALGKLQDNLTAIGGLVTNYQYGVVQLGVDNTDGQNFKAWPGAFTATPRLDPTLEQSTVTAQFLCLTAAGCPTSGPGVLTAQVAVRSANVDANNKTSTVGCKVTVAGSSNVLFTTKPQSATNPFYEIPRSRLVPQNQDPSFPLAMVPKEDNAINLGTSSRILGQSAAPADQKVYTVTLSCIDAPKS